MTDRRVLLVDDEAGLRKVLAMALADAGNEMYTAESGEKALEIFAKVRPAIVLTDIKMPGMDGIELLRIIKEREPDTEVIMLTGHGDIDLAIKSLKFQATDFITKPINDEALEIAMQRARERILMRRQLREYTENLEGLVAEKSRRLLAAERLAAVGETVAGLSHAIKNIAGSLEGGAFVLEKGMELDDRTYLRQGWEMIKGNVEKITKLSLDLLDFGKSADVSLRLADPNEPAREVAQLIRPRAVENDIGLCVNLDESLGPVRMDPEAIHRCLMNLATNALDACLEAGDRSDRPEIRISSGKASGDGIQYQVADTGCGMEPEVYEKLFQIFFTTKGAGGTGIGLVMTRKIIDRHGGRMAVSSEAGVGSTFTLFLPKDPESNGVG